MIPITIESHFESLVDPSKCRDCILIYHSLKDLAETIVSLVPDEGYNPETETLARQIPTQSLGTLVSVIPHIVEDNHTSSSR